MAKHVLTNVYVSINTVDLSDHLRSISMPISIDDIDAACMGANGWKAVLPGLKGASLDLTMMQDFAASSVDATLWAVVDGGVAVALKLRVDAGAISATNPEYQFNGVLTGYNPFNGNVGQGHEVSISFVSDGTVTRAISA